MSKMISNTDGEEGSSASSSMNDISPVSSSSSIENHQHTPTTTRAYSILSGKVQGDCSLADTSISQVTAVTVRSKLPTDARQVSTRV